ncbi:unnamed protein product [Cylicostephanus goldi]|uniref:Uncharacterized protein n=1 Tax=Cylicostephanus goldi TaxID=71465 RepID=A0A3P6R9K4_CYLGO|nr:unnamed protein product [Cylicostephanus goldi]
MELFQICVAAVAGSFHETNCSLDYYTKARLPKEKFGISDRQREELIDYLGRGPAHKKRTKLYCPNDDLICSILWFTAERVWNGVSNDLPPKRLWYNCGNEMIAHLARDEMYRKAKKAKKSLSDFAELKESAKELQVDLSEKLGDLGMRKLTAIKK